MHTALQLVVAADFEAFERLRFTIGVRQGQLSFSLRFDQTEGVHDVTDVKPAAVKDPLRRVVLTAVLTVPGRYQLVMLPVVPEHLHFGHVSASTNVGSVTYKWVSESVST
jgi:hypothetical protein